MNMGFDLKGKEKIIIVGVFIVVISGLFQFLYLPKSRELRLVTSEYKGIKSEIDNLYNFIGTKGNLEENIIEMRKNLAVLESALPFEKEMSNIIKQLNDEARRFGINVISLKPENLEICRDQQGNELKVSDYFCKSMPLTLNVESRYKALGEFLMSIEKNKSPLISIEEINIKRDNDKAPDIKAEIGLVSYILGK